MLAMLMVLTLVCYWPALNGEFVFDDAVNLRVLTTLADPGTQPIDIVLGNQSGRFGRPLAMLSFVIDYELSGFSAPAMKRTNLLAHLLCGVVLFAFARRLWRLLPNPGSADTFALLTTALWLLHPMQVSTVMYVVQRMAILSALFVLLGCYAYLRARTLQQSGHLRQGLGWLAIALLVCWPAAVFSKENGILLITFLAVLEWGLFQAGATVREKRAFQGLYLVCLVLPALAAGALIWGQHEQWLNYHYRDFSLYERLLTAPRALFYYLGASVLPLPGSLGFFHDDFLPSRSLTAPLSTLASMFGVGALLMTAWWLCCHPLRKIYLCAVAFFVLGHSLEISIFPLELIFEHRNYLPLTGVALAVAALVMAVTARSQSRLGLAAAMLLLMVLIAMSSWRADVWQSGSRIAEHGYLMHPRSSRAATAYASAAMSRGELGGAFDVMIPAYLASGQKDIGLWLQLVEASCASGAEISDQRIYHINQSPQLLDVRYQATILEALRSTYTRTACNTLPLATLIDNYAQALLNDARFQRRRDNWAASVRFHMSELLQTLERTDAAIAIAEPMAKTRFVYLGLSLARAYRRQQAGAEFEALYQHLLTQRSAAAFPDDLEAEFAALRE